MAQVNFKAINDELLKEMNAAGGVEVTLADMRTDRGRGIGMDSYIEEGQTYAVPTLADLKFIKTTSVNGITATYTRLQDANGTQAKVFDSLFDRSCFRLKDENGTLIADTVVPTQLSGVNLIPARATRAECWTKMAGHSFKVVKIEPVKALGFHAGPDGKNEWSVKKGYVVDPSHAVDAKIYHLELIA